MLESGGRPPLSPHEGARPYPSPPSINKKRKSPKQTQLSKSKRINTTRSYPQDRQLSAQESAYPALPASIADRTAGPTELVGVLPASSADSHCYGSLTSPAAGIAAAASRSMRPIGRVPGARDRTRGAVGDLARMGRLEELPKSNIQKAPAPLIGGQENQTRATEVCVSRGKNSS